MMPRMSCDTDNTTSGEIRGGLRAYRDAGTSRTRRACSPSAPCLAVAREMLFGETLMAETSCRATFAKDLRIAPYRKCSGRSYRENVASIFTAAAPRQNWMCGAKRRSSTGIRLLNSACRGACMGTRTLQSGLSIWLNKGEL
jgi:hypothetical protein